MGHKVNPIGFRLGIYRNWDARWYADREYTKLLHEDLQIRRMISGRLRNAGLARIETERSGNQLTVIIHTAKPGIVIGKQGASVDALRDELERITGKKVRVTIHEIKNPELDAKLVAENVASQLEKRIAFRRAMKQAVMRTMRAGAKGVKVQVSGRLGGAEMSRREWDRDGRVPLHTLRANIDFGQAEARTTFGRIGVSVWIYKGDFVTATGEPIVEGRPREEIEEFAERRRLEAAAGRPAAVAETAVAEEVELVPVVGPTVVEGVGGESPVEEVPEVSAEGEEPEMPELEIPEDVVVAVDLPETEDAAGVKRVPARRKPSPPRRPLPGKKVVEPEEEEEEE